MNTSNTIFLKPGMVVDVDGVKFTFEDIMENKIDSVMFRKHLEELDSK